LPKDSAENKQLRLDAMESAQKEATLVPLKVLGLALEALELSKAVAAEGNPNTLSDAGVAALCARAAGDAALYNVLINLPGIADSDFARGISAEALAKAEKLRAGCNAQHERILGRLSS
ncbi:MAG: cyclodeaminase/cyclohydrolase family protein, partial [Candidatus Obscuribacterales bacterium]|nr:cyclodeaminase/cyclohydrolase family protein [Candidatus Obscuribacterales bacterium]